MEARETTMYCWVYLRVNRGHNLLFARALPSHLPLRFARVIYVGTSETQYQHMLLPAHITSGG